MEKDGQFIDWEYISEENFMKLTDEEKWELLLDAKSAYRAQVADFISGPH